MRATILTAVLGACAVLGGCGGGGHEPVEEPLPAYPWFETTLTLRTIDGMQSDVFFRREPVAIVLTVRNITDETMALRFADWPFIEYEIGDEDGWLVWRWSETGGDADIDAEEWFAPGQSKSWEVIWNQGDRDNVLVPAGAYDADGFLPDFLDDPAVDHDDPLPFDIVPQTVG